MIHKPKASIIIPVYNTGDALIRCLDSVLAQSEKDMEVVVVNDGSTDNSGSICDRFAAEDDRVIVVHQPNQGSGPARNTGLDHSTGEYLCFVDSDDTVHPDLVKDNVTLAQKSMCDIVFFGFTVNVQDSAFGERVIESRLQEKSLERENGMVPGLPELLESGARLSIWNKLFRADYIHSHQIRFPNLKRGQDIGFFLEALRYVNTIQVNSRRYYFHQKLEHANNLDPETPESHLLLYRRYSEIYGENRTGSRNSFTLRLLVLWFFYVSPLHIVKNRQLSYRDALEKIRQIVLNNLVREDIESFRLSDAQNIPIRTGLWVLKRQSPFLLYLAARMNLLMKKLVGVKFLRNQYQKST